MINDKPNMSKVQIFKELPLPSKVDDSHGALRLIYKAVFIAIKLLLDIRLNLVKISEGKKIITKQKSYTNRTYVPPKSEIPPHPKKKVDNAVIKEKDVIK